MKTKKVIGWILVIVMAIAVYVAFTSLMIPTDNIVFFGIMMNKWMVFPLVVIGAVMLTAFLGFLAWCFQV